MTTTTIDKHERLKLRAWSDRLNTHVNLASYTIYQNGLVYIEPTQDSYSYFNHLGLPLKKHFFELDLNHSPLGSVAKAFGMNYDDSAVRHLLSSDVKGNLNGPQILSVALKGSVPQMGALESVEYPSKPNKAVSVEGLLPLNSDVLPKSLIVTARQSSGDMTTHNILIRDGDTLRHGYYVTLDDISEKNDRLAIYAGVMDTLSKAKGVNVDQSIGFKLTAEGQPCVVCLDATRPPIKILKTVKPDVKSDKEYAVISTSQYKAKRALTSPLAELKTGSEDVFANHVITKLIKNLVQDMGGINYNGPMLNEGAIYSGRINIPAHMSLDALVEQAKVALQVLPNTVDREVKLFAPAGVDKIALIDSVEATLVDMVRHSHTLKPKIDEQMDKLAYQVTPPEDRKRPVLEFDAMDMQT